MFAVALEVAKICGHVMGHPFLPACLPWKGGEDENHSPRRKVKGEDGGEAAAQREETVAILNLPNQRRNGFISRYIGCASANASTKLFRSLARHHSQTCLSFGCHCCLA